MKEIPSGIVMLVRLVQPENVNGWNVRTPSGMVTLAPATDPGVLQVRT